MVDSSRMPALLALALAASGGLTAAAAYTQPSDPSPPGYTLTRTGDIHDFDYFAGAWVTRQRRLKARGVGSSEWEEFPAIQCLTPYLDGRATVDELYMPTKQRAGLTVRVFDPGTHQWSIYWVSGPAGRLDPVVGGFQGAHGEFYGEDTDGDRPIKVRYQWDKLDHDHARWQQAFSYDGRTWEINWIAEFVRADAAKLCRNGQPTRR
jgi:hypothetical protein